MKKATVRISINIPAELHRRLQQAAIREGCTVRQMMLQSIERAVKDVEAQSHKRRLRLDPPIVPSTGKPFDLSNAQIYDVIEFP